MDSFLSLAAALPIAILVIVRLGGVAIFAPALSSSVVPVRTRVAVSILIGLSIVPLILSRASPFSAGVPRLELFSLLPLVALEITFGAIIGFLATLPLMGAQAGGVIMGQQMGFGVAQLLNPAFDEETDVIGQVFFFFALVTFLLMGGLEHMTLAVIHSFDYVPLGGFSVDNNAVDVLCGLLLASFELALRIAAPLLALVLLETVAMSFIAKTVPQFNILSLGFPIRILAGFLILAAGLLVMHEVLIETTDSMLNTIHEWATTAPHH